MSTQWDGILLKAKKSTLIVHWKDWCWSWNSSTLATWCKELTHLKRPWYWERLKAGGEGDNWGWDSWMASPTRWTWVWVSYGQGSCPMDKEAWRAAVHGVAKSETWLSDWTELRTALSSRNIMWASKCNFKSSSSHIAKIKINQWISS